MSRDVDAFVRRRVQPEHRAVVAALRKLMREHAPTAAEQIAYGIPMWRANTVFAFLSPTKKGITFGFTHGGEFADRYGLLRGAGKRSKHLKVRSVAEMNAVALRYYIRQAVRRDAKA